MEEVINIIRGVVEMLILILVGASALFCVFWLNSYLLEQRIKIRSRANDEIIQLATKTLIENKIKSIEKEQKRGE